MRATAKAQPNIALIKYWGKRDVARNLPAVGSISITLADLYTMMSVEFDASLRYDKLAVNGEVVEAMLARVSRCLDLVAGPERKHAQVISDSNFPIAAGLASSASAFAALVVAADAACDAQHTRDQLASLAGRSSGSAARSLLGGFVELRNAGDDIAVSGLCDGDDWPLKVVVAITASGPKAVGSTEAMELSRKTSPFFERWVEYQDADLDEARAAIEQRDFARLAAVAEHNCLKMHSVMWGSRPPMVYWNATTLACMETIRQMQAEDVPVFFTIDAGPQLKAICEPGVANRVREQLAATPGVEQVMMSGLGGGARVIESD
ncbi:MAG: diphosphomevalonate decarboxylase [Woeseiaceae bacterium]